MASLLRRMSSRKEKISEPEAPPTPAADEDDGRVNVRAYNKKVGCPLPPNPHTTPPRFAPPPNAAPPPLWKYQCFGLGSHWAQWGLLAGAKKFLPSVLLLQGCFPFDFPIHCPPLPVPRR